MPTPTGGQPPFGVGSGAVRRPEADSPGGAVTPLDESERDNAGGPAMPVNRRLRPLTRAQGDFGDQVFH